MSPRRPSAPAPQIPGFTLIKPLGTGGFSDVYLYEQHRPNRKVAIKVLLADVSKDEARQRFEAEANLMAQLSSHPYIVTIYQAEITDDGRSYLAMEYCSRPSLDARYRRGVLSVDEALTLAIQLCSAVHTAHLAGIVHRDIKPANVLTTDYNRPALTDFGISGTVGSHAAGMSVPWSAPEAFDDGLPPGVRMDVYSLGATIYTVLAGHSPFVRPGQDNSQAVLIERICNTELKALDRADVPDSLNQALAVAMAKESESRFGSAAELARSLQRIQIELGFSVTDFEVLEDPAETLPDEEGEATRVRSVTSISDAQRPLSSGPMISFVPGQRPNDSGSARPVKPRVAERFVAAPDGPEDSSSASAVHEADAPQAANEARSFPKIFIAVGILLVLLVGGAIAVNRMLPQEQSSTQSGPPITASDDPKDALIGGTVPTVENFKYSTVGKTVTFRWENPEPNQGDSYRWAPITATDKGKVQQTKSTSATTAIAEGGQTCIEVKLVRDDGRISEASKFCTG
ncbi:serine/threonine protein kinase [Glutamicibacter sp. JL.03c]|uniref:serine/threonine-protein kinase n=1 Tax=Glutamicibacter sp. JL.03c TaxID=2984842 RepID=UPI0021F70BD5|nr:serine/threonine-protein kinase [Glutamicibacter sp. JL.03c]UYQ78341.1 serine/threonine protein kinase [Glutamicibacter sp. JL.03c]